MDKKAIFWIAVLVTLLLLVYLSVDSYIKIKATQNFGREVPIGKIDGDKGPQRDIKQDLPEISDPPTMGE